MNRQNIKKEIDLIDIWQIALKKKWLIFSIIMVFIAAAGLYSLTKTPEYRASTTLMIEEPNSGMLNLQDLFDKSGYINQNFGTYFKTQLKLLTSRSLAERVVSRMELASSPELRNLWKKSGDALASLKGFFTFKWMRPDSKSETDEIGPEEMENPVSHIAFLFCRSSRLCRLKKPGWLMFI